MDETRRGGIVLTTTRAQAILAVEVEEVDQGRRRLVLRSVRRLGRREVSVLSSRGQLVLPKAIRDDLHAQVGDRVQMTVLGRQTVLLRLQKSPTVASLYGVLGANLPDEMRNLSWEDIRTRAHQARSWGSRASEHLE